MATGFDWVAFNQLPTQQKVATLLGIRAHLVNIVTSLQAYQAELERLKNLLGQFRTEVLKMRQAYIDELKLDRARYRSIVIEYQSVNIPTLRRNFSALFSGDTPLTIQSEAKVILDDLLGLLNQDPDILLTYDDAFLDAIASGQFFQCTACGIDPAALEALNAAWMRAIDFDNASSALMLFIGNNLGHFMNRSGGFDADAFAGEVARLFQFDSITSYNSTITDPNEIVTFLTAVAETIAGYDRVLNKAIMPGETCTNPDGCIIIESGTISANGLAVFREYVGMNGDAAIVLEAEGLPRPTADDPNKTLGEGGLTPSDPGNNTIYLASNVPIATIVHEFGHQLDQALGLHLSGLLPSLRSVNVSPYRESITTGFAATTEDRADGRAIRDFPEEVYPDWFMTAILDRLGYSAPGIQLGEGAGSGSPAVQWAISNETGTLTNNARDAQIITEAVLLVELDPHINTVQFQLHDGTCRQYSKGGTINECP